MAEGGIMYYIYLIGHFVLSVIWLSSAIYLDFIFLNGFSKASVETKKNIIKRIRFLSDKTEMIASFFLPLLGVLMLIDKTFWLKVGMMHIKITIAFVAIGIYHASRAVLRKIEIAIDNNTPINKLYNRYIAFRAVILIFLLTTVSMIIIYKGGVISTIFLIKSWLI